MKTVAVLGLGYVGFPLVELLVKSGKYSVIGLDISKEKVEQARRNLKSPRFNATGDFKKIREADISVVCVPTPVYENFKPDYGPVRSACESIARNLKEPLKNRFSSRTLQISCENFEARRDVSGLIRRGAVKNLQPKFAKCSRKDVFQRFLKPGQLVIIESTINPGTCEEVVMPVFEKFGLIGGKDFLLAHCPERIDPGNKKWTLENIPRNVGGLDEKSSIEAAKFYRSFLRAEVKILSCLKAAEATKIIENTFRDINIAYVNELAMSFDTLGIDLPEVIDGAKTKPFAFMPHYPGVGVGGHCIPIDPYYLIERAQSSGFTHKFLKRARAVNNGMPAYTVGLLEKELGRIGKRLYGAKVGLLGLAYKKDIGDLRESPALRVLKILKRKGAKVTAFDPYIPEMSGVASAQELMKKCGAIILATAHEEFLKITPQQMKNAGVKIVIDGRNCLPKEEILAAGIAYKGIGH